MKIKVDFTSDAGFDGCSIGYETERELGVIYRFASPTHSHYYEVIEKDLFFIGVLKYGIDYEIITD